MDVHRLHGDVTYIKVQLAEIKEDLEYTYQKTSRNEMDINRLKRNHDMHVNEFIETMTKKETRS